MGWMENKDTRCGRRRWRRRLPPGGLVVHQYNFLLHFPKDPVHNPIRVPVSRTRDVEGFHALETDALDLGAVGPVLQLRACGAFLRPCVSDLDSAHTTRGCCLPGSSGLC